MASHDRPAARSLAQDSPETKIANIAPPSGIPFIGAFGFSSTCIILLYRRPDEETVRSNTEVLSSGATIQRTPSRNRKREGQAAMPTTKSDMIVATEPSLWAAKASPCNSRRQASLRPAGDTRHIHSVSLTLAISLSPPRTETGSQRRNTVKQSDNISVQRKYTAIWIEQ